MDNESDALRSPISNLVRDCLAVLLLWSLVIAGFWRIALAGRVLAGGDVFTYFYPYWAEATRAMRVGRLPLWNPYLFMGAPFLANSQVGVFYPLNWPLWLLLPAHQSVHLTIVLHLCLAALNSYLWGRCSLRLGRVGAWTVGVAFALGGYLGAQVEHVNQLQGLAWLPLMLAASQRVSESTGRRAGRLAFVGLVAVVGLVFLAGHTQTAFISLVGLAVYGLGPLLWRGLRRREWRPLTRQAALVAIVAGVGAALAAVQLLPTWELSRLSVRAGGLPFNERVSFSLAPLYLPRALLPGFAAPVPPEQIEYVAYVGVAGLALAAIAISKLRSSISDLRPPIFLLTLGLFLSLGLYNPFYLLLARFVPGFAHFRVPARWLALYALGMAALAGWGADVLFRHRGRVDRPAISWFVIALVLLAGWAAVGVRAGWPTVAGWVLVLVLALASLLATARAPRPATLGLLTLLVGELLAASGTLPHSRATAPQAFTSLRPAIAHLLSAGGGDGGPAARFISMSDITFDPGDLPEIEGIYGPQLSAGAFYEAVIAAKHKEVLSPDLPLAFGIPAVDGYDGGVLPLARYVTLQRLFLPEDEVSMDGRLRENLTAIPDGRWLNLFNVRYVITDKLRDAWLDDVFYDLQFGAHLGRGEAAAVAHMPRFEATALGLVSYLRGGAALPQGAVVGVVEVGFGEGVTRTFELRAGEHTAEGLYGPDVAHVQATVGGRFWPPALNEVEGGRPEGTDYVTRLRWSEPAAPTTVVVRATLTEGELVVRGVSLIDERTGGFQALVLSDQGRFRLAHSGDVKIYENLDVLPRAFIVHDHRRGHRVVVADDEAALPLMRDESFDPATGLVLSEVEGLVLSGVEGLVLSEVEGLVLSGVEGVVLSAEPLQGLEPARGWAQGRERVRVTSYAPERVEIDVVAESSGYLVLTDAWYPGWKATVDGEPTPVHRADVLFRAVAVDAGHHRVVFTFRPVSLLVGAAISVAGLLGLLVVATLSKAGAML